ncbi:MAG: hypothetical protein JXP34_03285, partial [Planctomycetes bacterium]|nr:hypothetical protein [Planctomycetota bacterium]
EDGVRVSDGRPAAADGCASVTPPACAIGVSGRRLRGGRAPLLSGNVRRAVGSGDRGRVRVSRGIEARRIAPEEFHGIE